MKQPDKQRTSFDLYTGKTSAWKAFWVLSSKSHFRIFCCFF